MASIVTNEAAYQLVTGGINFSSDTIKARLCVAGTPGKDDTSLTGHTAATGSTDQTLASKTITKDTTNDRIVFDCADLSWSSLAHSGSATHIAVYRDGANDAARVPLFYVDVDDLSLTTSITQANYTVPTTGIGYIQQ